MEAEIYSLLVAEPWGPYAVLALVQSVEQGHRLPLLVLVI